MNKEEFNKLYEELKKSKFRQQKFPGWRPLPTISCITIIFIVFGILFIIIGILILIFIYYHWYSHINFHRNDKGI